jgi:amidase
MWWRWLGLRQMGSTIVTELLSLDVCLTPTLTQPPLPVEFYDMSLTDMDAYNAFWASPFNVSVQPAMSLPDGMAWHGLGRWVCR